MRLPAPEPGLVISYAFLWKRESEAGREEGVKDRPCAIVLVTRSREGGPADVTAVPITSRPPDDPARVLELPARVIARLGLSAGRCWVVLDEFNRFGWPGYDLRPVPGRSGRFDHGLLPPDLFAELARRIRELAKTRRVSGVRRD